MAESKDNKDLKERIILTEQARKAYAELDVINAKIAKAEKSSAKNAAKKLEALKKEKEKQEEILDLIDKEAETIEKKSLSALKSFARISGDVKKNLGSLNSQSNIYVNIQRQIIKEEETRAGLTVAEIEASEARASYMRDISSDLLQQAKATTKAEDDARGINEFEARRKELLENNLGLTKEQLELAKDLLDQEELLYKKEERLKSIKASQENLFDALPDSMQKGIGFGSKLINTLKTAGLAAGAFLLLGALFTAAVSSFTKLDEAAKEFRSETGITNSQMTEIRSQTNEIVGEFASLGVEAKDVLDTVAALKGEFSDITQFSKETTAALTVLNKNFGVSAENSAKVQSQLESIAGLSSETAANIQLQIANMSNLAGVAPAKVFADIAENVETTSTFFKGDINLLAKQAVEARRLGTNLKSVAETAEKLLDFESGIEEELTAATFVGGQFNLSQARALAYEGKLVEAREETLRQLQRSGDFRKKDYFTQQQLAKAAGMSVEEINKQLNNQEKLNSLTTEQRKQAEAAIEKGLDITNINKEQLGQEVARFSLQQEQQSQLEKLSNAFTSIAATVGSVLNPLLEAIIPIVTAILTPIQWFAKLIGEIIGNMYILIPLALALGRALAPKPAELGQMIGKTVARIMDTFAQIPLGIGIPLGIAAVAGFISLMSKAKNAGDLSSPASGRTMVSTKEGGLYELSPNDDIVAAPGAAAALQNANAGGGVTTIQTGGVTPNLAVLSAPLNAMINEIKALRADLNSGKIAVYMDTAKVTSNVAKSVDQSARNNYNIAST